ncbi:MAG: ABC transporter permease [Lachnospiraceae bacterium]|nr:ABC transporter permease [Lachnospiraceae bacterium]
MKLFVRGGIRSNLRARGRSILFFILILLLTTATILALGVRLYCDHVLRQCDEQYQSIAVVEYMGAEYPNPDVADTFARAAAEQITAESIEKVAGVKSVTMASEALGYLEGYHRLSVATAYESRGVIEVGGWSDPQYHKVWVEDEGAEETNAGHYEEDQSEVFYYFGRVSKLYYGSAVRPDVLLNILPGTSGFIPEKGKTYMLHGVFIDKNQIEGLENGIFNFQVLAFDEAEGESETKPYQEVTPGDPLPERFAKEVIRYQIINNYVTLHYAQDIRDTYEFQQGILYLDEGEMPAAGDEGACIVSADIASQLSVKPGDEISLQSLISSEEDRFDLQPAEEKTSLKVAGVAHAINTYPGTVWVIGTPVKAPFFGYQIATISLENAKAVAAVDLLQERMPENVRVQLLDQGYQDAAAPFASMKETATNILMVCIFGSLTVLFLFGFLFVSRQKDTVKTMICLGTEKKQIVVWLLAGALMISGSASILGAVLGQMGLPRVFAALEQMWSKNDEILTIYSETVLGISKEAVLDTAFHTGAVWMAALFMILASLVLCLVFMPGAFRDGTFDRGKSHVRIPSGKTSVSGRGSLRFAMLSIRRGGLRSLVVPVVSLVLTIAVIVLGGIFGGWQRELDRAMTDTKLDGMVVSTNGRYYSGLVVQIDAVRDLLAIEDVEDVYVSKTYPYWFEDSIPHFGEGSFAQESRMDWILKQPELVSVNALAGSKEFYYSEPTVTWLDGWDESCLAKKDGQTYLDALMYPQESEYIVPAIVSTDLLKARDLALGDTFSIWWLENRMTEGFESVVQLRVVGAYQKVGTKEQIYVPLYFTTPWGSIYENDPAEHPMPEWWYAASDAERLDYYYYRQQTFSTCRFTLKSAARLDEMRLYLQDKGFSRVGRLSQNRTTIVLRDAAFLKLTETLKKYIATGRVVLVMISVVIVLIGFIISWLMIHARKREFALMRGFGAKMGRIFFSFFLEQMMLMLPGVLLGCAAMLFLRQGLRMQMIAVLGYVGFYLLGCAASILMTGRTKLMELLAVRE